MSVYSYVADDLIAPLTGIYPPTDQHRAAGQIATSSGGKCSISLCRATSISNTASEAAMMATWFSQDVSYASGELKRALVNVLIHLPEPNPRVLDLLEQWYATPSHQPNEYWDDLKAEVAASRFSLLTSEG